MVLRMVEGHWIEIKSGVPQKSDAIQLALQAILVADAAHLPPESLGRWCEYLRPTGKWSMQWQADRRDFDEAYKVIKECCQCAP